MLRFTAWQASAARAQGGGVPDKSCTRLTARSTSLALGTFLKWDSRIWRRPLTSGFGTTTWRSNRPGLTRALSSDSGKLVAAMQMTPSLGLNLQGHGKGVRAGCCVQTQQVADWRDRAATLVAQQIANWQADHSQM